ncbi:Ser-tRNA(Thr) hydrolase /threonyl-tRNA synthetase [Pseudomonas sp. NFPP10]|jgi:threonyl-tRNA synthetase|uniref:threonine--tRNA ligase n=1 Tax=unclassified Pseudomonas TaxID=196821 RepID=UPI000886263D|nr:MULTISPECIES: threonine--tRNA ligase [unclassified Pseudomonas]PZP04145.1 MAG: threonine--tRNA ligase [Pseudomonas protegens]SDA30140.1 Ser-tRNA(Thr) hydrolase /threonyl-tRNA synthetase [Pseudomonas sp. NFPP12]SEM06465.1 Ser-tRNA(Thr) hydrolase /threonyl-tRNA synthetase [Pseudomonas sp. NFPP10]SFJ97186.1 Ser-tRNA(Thr) hydrolase /threonyl-tRNA synthetase [Pseudomonas sp. NFPP08]SFN18624.1 Ser-tRNA(Thr) hydrolase /threonyl-tRNA synthetase [Pseudomonas sp. NFPP05]
MIRITLPDGACREYDQPLSVFEVAASIGSGLAKAAVAGRVNGQLVDCDYLLHSDARLSIVTARDPEGLEVLRHSCAHLLAMAVKQLFPSAQVAIGPVIEDGFFYDFAHERPFTPEDLELIEARMHSLAATNHSVRRRELSREQALQHFADQGEHYKVELIRDLPPDAVLSLYRQGDFEDLCRGPHLRSTGQLRAFKLTKVAGAYWRGDARNAPLQRIYGTCWGTRPELEAYLLRLEQAQQRDHRKLGQQLDLFHFDDCAPGSVFWHAKGWTLFQELIGYMRRRQEQAGYQEVNTPDVMDRGLWETSGHWQNYRDHMFTTTTQDQRTFALKPMNCPGAVAIFGHGRKSYRDLPLRIAEFGKVHRYEPSGALHGLLRVRHFTQDDAHIFCTPQQMQSECAATIALVYDIYKEFGFDQVAVKLSTRPDHRIGSDEVWDQLEEALVGALQSMHIDYRINPGEGAFYGPKLEFVLRDAIGRDWQCGTLQVDLNLPERFAISYIDERGERCQPVMLHRALFGSLERFIGILLEHHGGALPLWLAPQQAVVLNISEAQADYARAISDSLRRHGLRASADLRNEKIGYKIREHSLQKVPYLLVVGEKEKDGGYVSLRSRNGEDLGRLSLEQALARMR